MMEVPFFLKYMRIEKKLFCCFFDSKQIPYSKGKNLATA